MRTQAQGGLGIDAIIGDRRDDILAHAQQHGVYHVRVFGSVARGEATADSDVDSLVDGLENTAWGGGGLLIDLQTLLGRRVDLVSEADLHELIREAVIRGAVRL